MIPRFDSMVTGNMEFDGDDVVRVAPFLPGTPNDDLAWWAGQLGATIGDTMRGVYRLADDGFYRLDPTTVEVL